MLRGTRISERQLIQQACRQTHSVRRGARRIVDSLFHLYLFAFLTALTLLTDLYLNILVILTWS